jgi:hypothetical protein
LIEAIMPSFDESLPVLVLAPAEPPCAPDDDEPPVEPDEPVTDELPKAPVPDDELPMAPGEPVLDEPDGDEPLDDPDADEPDEPLAPLDEPLRPPLLPDAPEPPVAPALPELLAPPMAPLLEPVAGLALDDALPDRLPDEPALADEPLLPLPRLPDLSWLDWSLPMLLPLPCLLASTPFPSLDF